MLIRYTVRCSLFQNTPKNVQNYKKKMEYERKMQKNAFFLKYLVMYSDYDGCSSLSPKISRNLAPLFGIPFVDGGSPSIFVQPFLGCTNCY